MILDPNGSSFNNDKAHAFWHSDTGQSVLKVIKAATKDSGSGDSSGGCDCYEVEEGTRIIVSEQSVTTSSGDPSPLTNASYDASLSGKTVTVTFDGMEYECTAVLDRFGEIALGGFNETTGTDFSEYPFCVFLVPGGSGSVLFAQTAGEHTIKVEAATKTVTPSDNFKLAVRASPGLRLKRQTSGNRPIELIYDSEAVTTDAAGNITDITDRTQFAMIPTDALFLQSRDTSQIALGYYTADGQLHTLIIPLGGGNGDMTKNVYDNDSTIQNAGGIKNYVQTYVSEYDGGGGSDTTFNPNDPGHGGRAYSDMFAEPLWERADDATAWGDPVWRAEIFNRGDSRIYGILRGDDGTVLDFIDGTGYMLQVSVSLNGLQRLVNAGVTGLLARIEKPDATERAFNALSYLPDSGDAPRLVLYAFGATPPEGVDIWVTATLLDWGGLG